MYVVAWLMFQMIGSANVTICLITTYMLFNCVVIEILALRESWKETIRRFPFKLNHLII